MKNKKPIDNNNVQLIRNLSIISHVDHGKTTLSDHLIASGGMIPSHLAGTLRALDFLPEEQRRGITIETTLATFQLEYNNKNYHINLIDTPGHVDFSGKVAESLRLVDGGLILVDAVEGIMAQTRTVLRQAIREKLKLVLFINKVDRLINELELPIITIQQRLERIISEIHTICEHYGFEKQFLPKFSVGSVIIGSATDGWAMDNFFVKENGKLSDVVEIYQNDTINKFPDNTNLAATLTRCIVENLPSPIEGQKYKFPNMLLNKIPDGLLAELHSCSKLGVPITIVGRFVRLDHGKQWASIVRVASGTLKRGQKLQSSLNSENLRIMRIIELHGRSSKDVPLLTAGQIGGLIVNKPIMPGDLLVPPKEKNFFLKNISYVQDPVVAISIEPLKINDISRLQEVIEVLVQATPGLEFESNQDTGELLLLGVGTLQLDVLASELKNMDFEIEVSDPIILQFEMPLMESMFVFSKNPKISIHAGRSSKFTQVDERNIFFKDNHSNQLVLHCDIEKEVLEGFIDVFKQTMRISPISGGRIKNFTLIVESYLITKSSPSYESGMITASTLIREALVFTKSTQHEPYYTIDINVGDTYLGNTLHELQKYRASIEEVSTEDECNIKAIIPVKNSSKLADTLRQVTDGNVFWSFPEVRFLPIIDE